LTRPARPAPDGVVLTHDPKEDAMDSYQRRTSGLLVPAHVRLGAPRTVHCKRERHHVYIGRPSKWGNPFVVGKHGSRSECVALYEEWLGHQAALMNALEELRGLVLGCWCAPRACHGEVLARLANMSIAEGQR
jgi:hypothetical protein